MDATGYDPFAPGPFAVGERTIEAADPVRGRLFPCEIWYPNRQRKAHRAGDRRNLLERKVEVEIKNNNEPLLWA